MKKLLTSLLLLIIIIRLINGDILKFDTNKYDVSYGGGKFLFIKKYGSNPFKQKNINIKIPITSIVYIISNPSWEK